MNCITHELTTEGNKLRAEILQVATMKWKTDLHLNKTELKVGSVVEKLGDATDKCLKKLKRKAPQICKEEVVLGPFNHHIQRIKRNFRERK